MNEASTPRQLDVLRPGVRIWLVWLMVMSATDALALYLDEGLLSQERWDWVENINSSPQFWASCFFFVAVFSGLAAGVGGNILARIALGAVIPLHIIFGLSLAVSNYGIKVASGPGLTYEKWFTTSVVSAFLLTQPLARTPVCGHTRTED